MRDSCETNCILISSHRSGAASAQIVKTSSIIVVRLRSNSLGPPDWRADAKNQLYPSKMAKRARAPALSRPGGHAGRLANGRKSRNVVDATPRPEGARGQGNEAAAVKRVRVITSARLHLGFLDLNGDLGRRFGSIGLAIDAFETGVELRRSPKFEVFGLERERSERLGIRIAESLGLKTAGAMTVLSAIPAHAGLGSGTQLALAIASAFRRFSGRGRRPI